MTLRQDELIALTYCRLSAPLKGYVVKRIGNPDDAEDIVQSVFESLLKPGLLISEQTVTKYAYTIAHNLVVDWMRRHACSAKAQDFFAAYSPRSVEDAESRTVVNDIAAMEMKILQKAGEKGARVYMMAVHEGISARDIALSQGMSERTVENHIFRTRKKVREACGKGTFRLVRRNSGIYGEVHSQGSGRFASGRRMPVFTLVRGWNGNLRSARTVLVSG